MARDMIEAEVSTGDNLSPTEVRERWIVELRRQGHRKCEGGLADAIDGRVCALGLLAEVAGLSTGSTADDGLTYYEIAEAAGLTEQQIDKIWRMNDGDQLHEPKYRKHTFPEIADVVEGWFK